MPKVVTQAEYARLRGVSRQMIHKWKRKGWLCLTPDGKVNVKRTDALLNANLDTDRGGDRTVDDGERLTPETRRAKLRELLARAEKLEIETERLRANLVDREGVLRARREIVELVSAELEAVPGRVADEIASDPDQVSVHRRLSEQMKQVADAIADELARRVHLEGDKNE